MQIVEQFGTVITALTSGSVVALGTLALNVWNKRREAADKLRAVQDGAEIDENKRSSAELAEVRADYRARVQVLEGKVERLTESLLDAQTRAIRAEAQVDLLVKLHQEAVSANTKLRVEHDQLRVRADGQAEELKQLRLQFPPPV